MGLVVIHLLARGRRQQVVEPVVVVDRAIQFMEWRERAAPVCTSPSRSNAVYRCAADSGYEWRWSELHRRGKKGNSELPLPQTQFLRQRLSNCGRETQANQAE